MGGVGRPIRYPTPRPRGLVRILAAVAALSCWSSAVAAGADEPKRVVVVYPTESDGAPGTVLVNKALRSTFAGQSPGPIEVSNEYVDTSRLRDAEFMAVQVSLLKRKYAGRKVDLVIAGLSAGLDFVLQYRGEVFPGVPVVHVAVDEREVKARRLPADVIGVPIRFDLEKTLELALRFHPGTRMVFVVAGSAPFDTDWDAEARRTFRAYEGRVEFVHLTGLPMDELLGHVARLPEQSIIYYLHIHRDGDGKPLFPADALGLLAAKANAPIYGNVDTYVGRGVVGGRVFGFEAEGAAAARLGLRILAGEAPDTIPVMGPDENKYLFDWRQMSRWGISEDILPPGSVVRHKEPTVWDDYKWHIIGGLTLCLVEGLLIAGLLIQLVKRRRADERLRLVVESAPIGMLMVGQDGRIVMANAQVEKLFGYRKDELLGQPVELLVPEPSRDGHAADRGRFFAAAEVRPMGLGRDLFGRRMGGEEFPVEIGLSPLRTGRGLFVLASVIDLTERRRAEDGLRASQRELQLLPGRLLEAQEAERRRIARELHDDLNQSLALLAMEIDALVRKPRSDGEYAGRMAEISAQVKDLSTTVHDLSHELHPSKLEHLGLVASVRGLCRDVSLAHELEVTFAHYPDPGAVPPGTSLCLYRIVQEALRNVVKHSGCRHASVELTATADAVHLLVEDDGVGFDPASGGCTDGLGLISIRERLHLVGGTITIDTGPGEGTRIDVRIPVSATGPMADREPESSLVGG